jgi:hypothetical protein
MPDTLGVVADTLQSVNRNWLIDARWLPAILLLLRTVIKMTVDQHVDIRTFAHALADLPIDTFFLSLSLLTAYVIQPNCAGRGLFWFIVGIAMAIGATLGSRRSKDLFDLSKRTSAFFIWLVCLLPAFWSFLNSISLLSEPR